MKTKKPEVVVVTGAGAGLGRAVVREFARHQASIGLLSRDPQRLEAAKKEVEFVGGKALSLPTDVADANAVDKAASAVEDEFGPIDVWVNVAMATVFAPFDEITPEEFKRVTEVTYLGYVYGTMAALRRMKKRDRGTIVQAGSALGYRSIPLQSPYCGAKHAINGFTDSIRCELIHNRSSIHICIVQLPAMNTPQFSWCRTRLPRHPQPVPPIFDPEVPARAVYYAAHHKRREIFVGFPTIKAIYGQDIAPGYADRYLGKSGYESQQTAEEIDPNRPNNLFQPVPGDYAAEGIFRRRAKYFSLQTWATLNRKPLGVAAGLTAVAAALIWKKSS